MQNFLDNFTKRGDNVYITLSTAGGLEMVVRDQQTGGIKTYAQVPCEYNESIREIANPDDFKKALERLFQMTSSSPKGASIYLNLPLVWFGYKDGLPLLLDDNAITNTILGELEQTYIFKKKDPIPVWFEALNPNGASGDTRSVFYTAIQKDVAEGLKKMFKEMGANLVCIACSLLENIKGLNYSDIISEEVSSNADWKLMVVNSSGFQMYGLSGPKITESYEEPLPLKSYDEEEVYSAIGNAAQISLMASEAKTLVILSETDFVCAKKLAEFIQFNGIIKTLDDNKYKEEPITELSLNVPPEFKKSVTIGMIGFVSPDAEGFKDVNFLQIAESKPTIDATVEIPLGNGQTIILTPEKATILAGIVFLFVAIVMGGIFLITMTLKNNLQEQGNQLNAQIADLDNQIKVISTQEEAQNTGFNPLKLIEETLKVNRTKIIAYSALGDSIPKNIYLTYFVIAEDGAINIKGCAKTVEDVYVFYKNIKDSVQGSDLRLSKLDLREGSLDSLINNTASQFDDAPYAFEITDMDEEQLIRFGLLQKVVQEEKPAEETNKRTPVRLNKNQREEIGEEGT